MATLRKRGDGWQVQVRKKGQKSISKTFSSKTAAQTWIKTLESEIERSVYQDRSLAEQTSLAEALDRYSAEVLPSLRSADSVASYLKTIKAHLGQYSLATLTPTVLAKYRDERLKVRSPQTVKHELGIINRVLKVAHSEWGIHLPHGIPTIAKPRLPKGRDRRLQEGELEALLDAIGNPGRIIDMVPEEPQARFQYHHNHIHRLSGELKGLRDD